MINKYPTKKLGVVLDYEQPNKYIVASTDYDDNYKTPVLTPGKKFILGYTDEKEGIYSDELPVIIFDDFTTASRIVDFNFKVKSSAMKILHVNKKIADIKYVFYLMQCIELNHDTHKRYWISEFSHKEIPLPSLPEQKKIEKKIEELFGKIDEAMKLREQAQKEAAALIPAALHQIFEKGKKDWEIKSLEDLYEITSSKRVFKSEWTENGVPFYRAREIVSLAKNKPFRTPIFISEDMYEKYKIKYGVPKEGDILATGVGTLGISYLVKNGDKFYFKDGNIIWLKRKMDIDSRFVKYFFESPDMRNQIDSHAGGATVRTFTIKTAKKVTIPLPSLPEQKKIVAYLDSLSEKAKQLQEFQQQTAEDMKALKQSILQKAFEGELC